MNDHLNKRAKEIIQQIKYVTIASVTDDGLPWNSPTFSAYDKDYNFYWGTHKNSQKAKNIRANNNVFLAIYDSTVPPGTGEGVYVKATAHVITEPNEIKLIYDLLKARHAPADFWEWDAIQDNGPIRLYTATPQQVWMNDGGKVDGYYVDVRTKVKL